MCGINLFCGNGVLLKHSKSVMNSRGKWSFEFLSGFMRGNFKCSRLDFKTPACTTFTNWSQLKFYSVWLFIISTYPYRLSQISTSTLAVIISHCLTKSCRLSARVQRVLINGLSSWWVECVSCTGKWPGRSLREFKPQYPEVSLFSSFRVLLYCRKRSAWICFLALLFSLVFSHFMYQG